MKTYQELMEVMSMKDMNKIAGGTEAQRKIAQDRQKKREAKAKGFDPNKEVLKDKPKQEEEPKKAPAPTPANTSSSAIVKAEPKVEKKPEPKAPSSAIVKTPERRPDIRKSQIGKWSEGIKKSPGKLAKRPESKPAKQEVEKVKVKVDEPKKRNDMEGQAAQRPGTTKPEKEVGQGVVDNMKKKRKKKKGPGILSKAKGLARRAYGVAKSVDLGHTGIATSGDLEGLSGKQSYE